MTKEQIIRHIEYRYESAIEFRDEYMEEYKKDKLNDIMYIQLTMWSAICEYLESILEFIKYEY